MQKNVTTQDEEIVDIKLAVAQKKKFRINGDNSKILELDISDMNTLMRMSEEYPKMTKIVDGLSGIDTDDEEEVTKKFKELDKALKEKIDYIFDSNVSEVCCGNATMYDIIDGVFRFEYLIETLTKLYEDNLNEEFNKMKTRVSKHTKKYNK